MKLSNAEKRDLIEPEHECLTTAEQCQLLGLSRSTYYYESCGEDPLNIELSHKIDELYTEFPFYGSRRMCEALIKIGYLVNRKRISRIMDRMGLTAIYPKKNLSKRNPEHRIYPYLLRNVEINRVNQVWSTDITYVRLREGFTYLVAVIDWHSRYVLSWDLSNSMEGYFCQKALQDALEKGTPEIFNSDQGSQFTSPDYTKILLAGEIKISMDGKGRALDNIFVERLWRTVKYENIYLKDYTSIKEAYDGLKAYFEFYNMKRQHQSLDYKTPFEVYTGNQ